MRIPENVFKLKFASLYQMSRVLVLQKMRKACLSDENCAQISFASYFLPCHDALGRTNTKMTDAARAHCRTTDTQPTLLHTIQKPQGQPDILDSTIGFSLEYNYIIWKAIQKQYGQQDIFDITIFFWARKDLETCEGDQAERRRFNWQKCVITN